jgi:transcriptional regulator with XRE-family HTH domain
LAKNTEPKVGQRVRALREQNGYSLRALAKRCGLSITSISQIERGENSPTVSTLHRLASALDVPIVEFFHAELAPKLVWIKRGSGLSSSLNGVVMESLGIGLDNQQLEPFRVSIKPGAGEVDHPISHPGEEFVHCLRGIIEYHVGDRNIQLARGDSLLFDATQPHTYNNPTRKHSEFLVVFYKTQASNHIQGIHMGE